MPEKRATLLEGFKAGLLALRAQGLEPTATAKQLVMKVCEGEMTIDPMRETLIAEHGR